MEIITRKIDDRTYVNYLFQSLNVDELKQICRDFSIKGYSKFKKSELIEFILDSLAEEELKDLLERKELEIINNGIELAIKKVKGEDRESVSGIKLVNPDKHEIELSFKGFNWEVKSFLSITLKNIDDPERDCDCRIGANMGLCSHFWIGFILSLKEGYLKLSDWTMTVLPEDFEKKLDSIKITVSDKNAEGSDTLGIIDESSDNAMLLKFINSSITVYEGEVTDVVERQSEFQDHVTINYHVSLKNVKIGPRITKKSDFKEEDIEKVDNLKISISERLQTENNLKAEDKISVNGKLLKDSFWGIILKNIRKVEKI